MVILSGIIFSHVPDKWGYKKTIKIFGTANLLAQIVILCVPNFSVRLLCFGIMGICYTKSLVTYVWLAGFVMEKNLSLVNGFMSSYDMLVIVILISYFQKVSRDLFGILLI